MHPTSTWRYGPWWNPLIGAVMALSAARHMPDARVRIVLIGSILAMTALVVVLLALRKPAPTNPDAVRWDVWPQAIVGTVFVLIVVMAADRFGIRINNFSIWLAVLIGAVGAWEVVDGLRRREAIRCGIGLSCMLLVAAVLVTPVASRPSMADLAIGMALTISALSSPSRRPPAA